MPKLLFKSPKYRRHSSREKAFVVLQGKRIYLPGPYGSRESRIAYKRLCYEWDIEDGPQPVQPQHDITIAELLVQYWRFAKRHYVKHGRVTDEQACTKAALRHLKEVYADTPAVDFTPLRLEVV